MTEWPSGVFIRADAVGKYGPERVRRWLATGAWRRLERGVYASIDVPLDALDHVRAALMAAGRDLTVVHESAAVLYGFGVLDADMVHLAGGADKTARARPGLRVHGYRLPQTDVAEFGGIRVTTADRTVVDLARSRNRPDALAVVDAALRIGASTPESLAIQLATQRRARGIIQARQIIGWGDGLAESPMESRLRFRVLDAGIAAPQLQYWVRDAAGLGIYRLDLAWPEYRVGLEYDGVDHQDRARQRHDLERRAWLAEHKWRVLWVTDLDVYRLYERMINRVRSMLG